MKRITIIALVIMCLCLSACGVSNENLTQEPEVQTEMTPEPENEYFKSDDVVDGFFTKYNFIAEFSIPADEIEKGNIDEKALIYIDDLSLEVINSGEFLAISMSSSVENEPTKLYGVFRDTIKAMQEDIPDSEIQTAWEEIHKSGYLTEDYDFNGILLTYVPSKELSWGTSELRIDMRIPLD